jgi:3-phosphoshikimate 1-carboxyvinyltransferase
MDGSDLSPANLQTNPLSPTLIVIPGKPLRGEISVAGDLALPGDKSLSHRAALFAALAQGESVIDNFLVSGVTRAMLDALTRLGVAWRLEGRRLTVQGVGLRPAVEGDGLVKSGVTLDCGNSATTLRLLAGALAAWGTAAVLDGSTGLRRRPMRRIVEPLQSMGVNIEATAGCAPLHLRPSAMPLRALRYAMPVASAQVKSCLLLAALAAGAETVIEEPGPSRDHTERMLRAMGVDVTNGQLSASGDQLLEISGQSSAVSGRFVTRLMPPHPLALAPLRMTLPGDMSAAAFLIVAALVTPGSQVTLRGVGLNPTRSGLIEALVEMGADILIANQGEQGGEPVGDLTVRHSVMHGAHVKGERVVRMIDEFPAFAVAAAYAQGRTVVADAEELRNKESDRITALGGELRALGVAFDETTDGFIVEGGSPVRGGAVQPHGDHRLAMSLAVAGLAAAAPVSVAQAAIIHESFPDFVAVLGAFGAQVRQDG